MFSTIASSIFNDLNYLAIFSLSPFFIVFINILRGFDRCNNKAAIPSHCTHIHFFFQFCSHKTKEYTRKMLFSVAIH